MGHVGAGQTGGEQHSIRVGPHQPTERKSGNNYKVRSKLVEFSLLDCQLYQCNPLLLAINDPHTMTIEPSILRQYELGADVSGRDPIGTFLFRLIKNTTVTSSPDDRPLSLMPPLKSNSDQAKITVVEVK
jgi:hypothetical protein